MLYLDQMNVKRREDLGKMAFSGLGNLWEGEGKRKMDVSQIGIFWCPLCGEKERTFQRGEGNTESKKELFSLHIKTPREMSPLKHLLVTKMGSGHSNLAMLSGHVEEVPKG